MSDPLSISVLGAGSVGCYVGGLLQAGGADVTFIGRERFQTHIAEHGLSLTHYERDPISLPANTVHYVTDSAGMHKADIIAVCVKSQDSAEAAAQIARHAPEDALIISFQNGVRNTDVLAEALPGRTILGAVVPYNITGTGPGRFHCGTEGHLTIGQSDDPRLSDVVAHLAAAGENAHTVPDIQAVQWGKLIVNLNNGLNALSGTTLHESFAQKEYRLVLAAMMEEGLTVCRDAGIDVKTFGKVGHDKTIKTLRLPTWLFSLLMAFIVKIDKAARSSMLDDLDAGKPTEVDYLQGEIVALAEQTGGAAPINRSVRDAVIEAFNVGHSPRLKGAAFRKFLP